MSMRNATKRTLAALGLLEPVKRVLNPVRGGTRNVAHVLKEMVYRLPLPFSEPVFGTEEEAALAEKLSRELDQKGIVALPDFLSAARLAQVQSAFGSMISCIQSGPSKSEKLSPPGYLPQTLYLEDEENRETRIVCSNNPFKHSQEFLSISIEPLILAAIAKYLRRPFYVFGAAVCAPRTVLMALRYERPAR